MIFIFQQTTQLYPPSQNTDNMEISRLLQAVHSYYEEGNSFPFIWHSIHADTNVRLSGLHLSTPAIKCVALQRVTRRAAIILVVLR